MNIKMKNKQVSELVGKTFTEVKRGSYNGEEAIYFVNRDVVYVMVAQEDWSNISIDDINGDLDDLVGSPILLAEEVSNKEFEKNFEDRFKKVKGRYLKVDEAGFSEPESYTWTFYKLATIKGYVDVRWFGTSNGYYAEGVNFGILTKKDYEMESN